jgi:hypothetical protein
MSGNKRDRFGGYRSAPNTTFAREDRHAGEPPGQNSRPRRSIRNTAPRRASPAGKPLAVNGRINRPRSFSRSSRAGAGRVAPACQVAFREPVLVNSRLRRCGVGREMKASAERPSVAFRRAAFADTFQARDFSSEARLQGSQSGIGSSARRGAPGPRPTLKNVSAQDRNVTRRAK